MPCSFALSLLKTGGGDGDREARKKICLFISERARSAFFVCHLTILAMKREYIFIGSSLHLDYITTPACVFPVASGKLRGRSAVVTVLTPQTLSKERTGGLVTKSIPAPYTQTPRFLS